ncbi:gliding motility-associated C-terminal domain-containing protein [Chitinophaga pollutisoli]|uniref:Gliding motility-associated C-terminal domain-containing protein n=1 Tax=Chitinophaga pollutisoli TaxID=3133966 RepID=A0ABZ2YNC6_9BACT
MLGKTRILTAFLTGSAAVAMAQSNPPVRPLEPGRPARLTAAATGATRYQWYRNGAAIPGAIGNVLQTGDPGAYTVIAYTGPDVCASDLSDPVILTGPPDDGPQKIDLAVAKTANAQQLPGGQNISYLLTVTNNGPAAATGIVVNDAMPASLAFDRLQPPGKGTASYGGNHTVTWKIPLLQARESATLTILAKAAKTGTIENTATVAAAQPDSIPANNRATHVLQVMPLFIPNAFTANADGRNDRFRIIGLERYPENELAIFNRWGTVVFQQKNYQQRWDAQGQEAGTYVYVLRIRDAAGEWQLLKGHVIVLR